MRRVVQGGEVPGGGEHDVQGEEGGVRGGPEGQLREAPDVKHISLLLIHYHYYAPRVKGHGRGGEGRRRRSYGLWGSVRLGVSLPVIIKRRLGFIQRSLNFVVYWELSF